MSSRLFAIRSAFRVASRQTSPRQLTRSAARRGFASQHDAAKSSDMPWLIGSVAITVPAAAFLISNGPKKAETHGASAREEHGEQPGEDDPGQESPEGEESKDEGASKDELPNGDNKSAHKSGQTGQDVPPPPADNSSGSENTEEKKEKHEEYKETVEKRDTKAATSSSDMPSKKTAGEHPREDPQKGEGEAKQKGGPSKE
ncbi:hypothetical protein BJ170DRAFT_599130 [Xylariales sp. AK1849]|nr:hypothetical protein BJ170DRAFT_599130 [Xylariales sp. AK1849]